MNNKAEYLKVKNELIRNNRNVKNFTFKFFNDYIADFKAAFNAVNNLQCDSITDYFINSSKTVKSKFYILNSGAYCNFLEIISCNDIKRKILEDQK